MYEEEAVGSEVMLDNEEAVSPDSTVYDEGAGGFEPVAATRWQFFWLCALILSFCYELPVARLTTMNRMNPRFFDIVFIIGMITIFPNLNRTGRTPRLFRIWAWIVAVFCVCAVVWFPFFPWYYGKYVIFFALKYVEGLLCMYMVLRIPITSRQKKILHYLVVVGGLVVAGYAVLEYLHGGVKPFISARTGEEVIPGEGQLWSTLGSSYFQVSLVSIASSVMALALFQSAVLPWSKLLYLGLGIFLGWPAFFSGARSGVVGCLAAWMAFFILARASSKAIATAIITVAVALIVLVSPKLFSIEYLAEKSVGIRRMREIKLEERLHLSWYHFEVYKWQGWLIPFVGGGFYVVPVTESDGSLRFRVGYGIHNAYLFAIEQGGIAAFVLFIAFLYVCWKELSYARHSTIAADVAFATGMQAFFFSMLLIAFSGLFWLNDATGNFCFQMLILIIIAVRTSVEETAESYYYEPDYADDFM